MKIKGEGKKREQPTMIGGAQNSFWGGIEYKKRRVKCLLEALRCMTVLEGGEWEKKHLRNVVLDYDLDPL